MMREMGILAALIRKGLSCFLLLILCAQTGVSAPVALAPQSSVSVPVAASAEPPVAPVPVQPSSPFLPEKTLNIQKMQSAPKAFVETPGRSIRLKILQGHPGLSWSNEPLQLEERELKGKGKEYVVTLKGTFIDKNTDVLWGTRKVLSTQDKVPVPLSFSVPVTGVSTPVKLRLINELGELKTSHVEIIVSDYVARMKQLVNGSSFKYSFSLGYSTIAYKEGTTANISMSGITAKGGILYQYIPDRWDLGLSFYATALPLSSNTGDTLRFIGVNYRVGYTFSSIPKPWMLTLMAGGYYTTMLVSSPTFGFTNLSGPQLFPVIKYQIGPKTQLSLYAKYSLIMAGLSLFSLSQGEFATGLSYIGLTDGKSAYSLSVDLANLSLLIGTTPITSSSLSFSVGYSW